MKSILIVLALVTSSLSFGAVSSEEHIITGRGQSRQLYTAKKEAVKERQAKMDIFSKECLAQNGTMEVIMKWSNHHRMGKRIFKAVARASVVCKLN